MSESPTKMDKVSGMVGVMVGKVTGDEGKVEEGGEKIHGGSGTGNGDTTDPNHPGIVYTKKGAMKQINIRPPPSSNSIQERDPIPKEDSHNNEEASRQSNIHPPSGESTNDHPGISYTKTGAMKQTCFQRPPPAHDHETENKWTADTTGTYDFGNNFDTHPHGNYAGPNLTKVISPPEDDDDLAIVQAKQGQEERYDLLHGGFPTGAPSPGLRGRSAEVVDKFDR